MYMPVSEGWFVCVCVSVWVGMCVCAYMEKTYEGEDEINVCVSMCLRTYTPMSTPKHIHQ